MNMITDSLSTSTRSGHCRYLTWGRDEDKECDDDPFENLDDSLKSTTRSFSELEDQD